ncbi:uncharacterized protein BT62DRAFT_1010383 [Guyanagaster necrorhizus]|uniref:Uncharacterized protein n=1 Tax=Guyanagaster necrorhizus TaxID=856835 RepID=A0A9P7VKX0_9AGAR|nr:uncharacterized protein BT62DRAFT_1010383 [Guyanagaster necrorhizus MCA 3950]KAG7442435.1 hypothetical protein BT62DRAFT_1010383 [Guyanagaster necrorhizus MCA 3950]
MLLRNDGKSRTAFLPGECRVFVSHALAIRRMKKESSNSVGHARVTWDGAISMLRGLFVLSHDRPDDGADFQHRTICTKDCQRAEIRRSGRAALHCTAVCRHYCHNAMDCGQVPSVINVWNGINGFGGYDVHCTGLPPRWFKVHYTMFSLWIVFWVGKSKGYKCNDVGYFVLYGVYDGGQIIDTLFPMRPPLRVYLPLAGILIYIPSEAPE